MLLEAFVIEDVKEWRVVIPPKSKSDVQGPNAVELPGDFKLLEFHLVEEEVVVVGLDELDFRLTVFAGEFGEDVKVIPKGQSNSSVSPNPSSAT